MTGKRLIDRLDAGAQWTGIPGLLAQPPRRRPLRWLPVVSLVLATAGLAISLTGGRNAYWIGYAGLMIGFSLSVWMPLKGPIKPWMTTNERVDEHDETMRRQAYLAVLPLVLIAAILALTALPALAVVNGWTMEQLARDSMNCAIYLMVLWNAVPTLHASWKWRPVGEE